VNKPLFETHKALFKRLNGFYIPIDVANAIQSCTVDREEHEAVLKRELYYKEHMEAEQRARIDEVERLNKQYGDCYYALAEANVEISRLKKELEERSDRAIQDATTKNSRTKLLITTIIRTKKVNNEL